jgi:hypothetical protein
MCPCMLGSLVCSSRLFFCYLQLLLYDWEFGKLGLACSSRTLSLYADSYDSGMVCAIKWKAMSRL